jgi:hypothetical protein
MMGSQSNKKAGIFIDIVISALVIGVSLAGVVAMAISYGGVNIDIETAYDPQARQHMIQSLQQFFIGFGVALILPAMLYMLLDKEEKLVTQFAGKQAKGKK